ncbi:hypothetical protein [Acidisoma sp. S159]|uniref:hypothetical protein n=1 Tax=Acidisoma sp. S159 TaxID=1747225 RepID=UPI00131B648A|nr:hypothetical protein [Acidisoma sp. S159]
MAAGLPARAQTVRNEASAFGRANHVYNASATPIKAHAWPTVGLWTVMHMPTNDGSSYCAILSKGRGDLEKYSFGFAFGYTTSHFYLNYIGPNVPTNNIIQVMADGQPIANLRVLSRQQVASGQWIIMADIPGREFIEQMSPPISKATMISVSAGGPDVFEMPVWGWDQIMKNMVACVELMK